MNALNDEHPEQTSSLQQLESIALEALAAPPGAPSGSSRGHGESDVRVALSNHPNFAPRADAEATANAHPDDSESNPGGQQIDEYCNSHHLGIPARLRLFVQICRAVHFAHQHAVIHGSLNPSNILVTAGGVPKLAEFGIARSVHLETPRGNAGTGIPCTPSSTPTQTGAWRSMPEYGSPEQLKGETVTTATDIYALGVVLYRLLTGRFPYRLETGTESDVLAAVFEQVPEKPSCAVTRLAAWPPDSTGVHAILNEPTCPTERREPDLRMAVAPASFTPADIAAATGCSLQRLEQMLTGDLDAIVLTALRKEPERRYASAEHFAEDLDRYLQGMPVRAHDDSAVYRFDKLVRRHPVLASIGLLVSLMLLSGMTAITRGLVREREQAHQAQADFQSAHRIIDEIFSRISTDRLFQQPGFFALRSALLQEAERFYQAFLDRHSADTTPRSELIEARSQLARITSLIGPMPEAISQYRQVAALWEELLAKDPTNRHYQEKLATTLSNLGVLLMPIEDQLDNAAGMFRRAAQLIESLIATEPHSPSKRQELGLILLNTAQIQQRQGQPDQALKSIDRVLEIAVQLAANDLDSLEPRIMFAAASATAGRILRAQPGELHKASVFYQQAVEIHKAIAQAHPELVDQAYQFARELSELGELQQKLGQLDQSSQNLDRSLRILQRLDESYPRILIYQKELGLAYNLQSGVQRQRAETAESLAHARKACNLFEQLVAEYPQDSDLRIGLAQSHNTLGRHFQQTGQSSEALRSFQRAMDLYESLPKLDAQTAYKLACNVSSCIPLLATKKQSAASKRAAFDVSKSDRVRRQFYGDRAMAALRRVAQTGHLDALTLETDTDLDALRDRADFRELIKELEKKGTPTAQ
jgi:serine/threonine protein kinase